MLKIFAVSIISGIIAFLPSFSLGFGAQLYLLQAENNSPQTAAVFYTLQVSLVALTAPFSQGVMVLLYYDQRVRKEGLDVEMAASALDTSGPAAPDSNPAEG